MRKAIVELVFGQVKEQRGFRRFSLRGKENVHREWQLVCAVSHLRFQPSSPRNAPRDFALCRLTSLAEIPMCREQPVLKRSGKIVPRLDVRQISLPAPKTGC